MIMKTLSYDLARYSRASLIEQVVAYGMRGEGLGLAVAPCPLIHDTQLL